MARQVAGQGMENVWMPAPAGIEEALVPAFIIEGLADRGYAVFVCYRRGDIDAPAPPTTSCCLVAARGTGFS
jgi:hypothetical protein